MQEFVVHLQVQESEEEAALKEAIEALKKSTNHGDESTLNVNDESYELYYSIIKRSTNSYIHNN